jgi:hypothetical protein
LINRLELASFAAQKFDSTGLNLHTKPGSRQRELAVFVHGWGGRGYSTWGDMPQVLFDGQVGSPVDVALYDYASGKRTWGKRGADPAFCAQQLAAWLHELGDDYSEIYIVAHSFGGLIAEAATQQYLSDFGAARDQPVTCLAALVLFASPRAGSGWAVPILGAFVREFGWLRRFSSRSEETDRFFSTYVESLAVASAGSRQFLLPRYACVAGGDWFVSKFSAGFGVPQGQRLLLAGSHSSIVNLDGAGHPQPRWLLHKVMREVGAVRAQWRREREQASRVRSVEPVPLSPVVVTELRADQPLWELVYNEVRRAATTSYVAVHDRRDLPDAPVDLLITVHDADAIVRPASPVRHEVQRACEAHLTSNQLSLGISPVGEAFADAERKIKEWLPDAKAPGSLYLEGASDASGLRVVMSRWIQAVVGRDPRRPQSASRLSRLLQAEPDPYDDPRSRGYL